MRPLLLKMSAFSSYAGEEVVDFRPFGEEGIYLITGDTGSGKSSIFDAITYALFGEMSMAYRSASEVRCKFANKERATFVELTFEYKGKEYTILRNPEYERPAKRVKKEEGEEKWVLEKSDAILRRPDGQEISGIKNVDNEIKEIIGLSADQFLQIAMLAQGSFYDLLTGASSKKTELLQKIFHTEGYRLIIDKLKENAKEIEKESKDIDKEIVGLVKQIEIDSQYERKIALKEELVALADKVDKDKIKELLEEVLKDNISKEKSILEKIELLEERIKEITSKIALAESINSEFEKLDNYILKQKELDGQISKLKSEVTLFDSQEYKDYKVREEALLENLKISLPKYEELEKRIKSKEKALQVLDRSQSKEKECAEGFESIDRQLEEERAKKEKALLASQEIETLRLSIIAMSKELELYKKMNFKLSNLEHLLKEAKEVREAYLQASNDYKAKNKDYESANESYRDSIAGILAEGLKDNIPCPVCGSDSHPSPASIKGQVVDSKELEKLKLAKDKANELALQLASKCQGKDTEIKALKQDLLDNLTFIEIDLKKENILNDANSIIQSKMESLLGKREELNKDLLIQENLANKREAIEKRIKDLEENRLKGEAQLKEARDAITESNATIKRDEEEIKLLQASLDFESQKEVLDKISSIEKVLQAKREEEVSKKEELSSKTGENKVLKENVLVLEKSLKGKEKVNISEMKEEEMKEQASLKEKKSFLKEVELANYKNKSLLDSLSEISNRLEKKFEERNMVHNLYELASGAFNKVDLETFVQQEFFDNIITRANEHFLKMSEGRYQMVREDKKTGNGKKGLDLKVEDNYNGSERSVKLMSGGEIFEATLSLALGLSEEVTARSGGIQFDTLFVDEGFGSLDKKTLDMAVQLLQKLSKNRLVAIISHVEELKSMMKNKINVFKNKDGSSSICVSTE